MKYFLRCYFIIERESHPSRGAWIEILRLDPVAYPGMVAPLAGCVD